MICNPSELYSINNYNSISQKRPDVDPKNGDICLCLKVPAECRSLRRPHALSGARLLSLTPGPGKSAWSLLTSTSAAEASSGRTGSLRQRTVCK